MFKFKTKSAVPGTVAILAVIVPILFLASCSTPTEEVIGNSGSLRWQQNCNRCHNFRDPGSLSDSQWVVAMRHMQIRGGLTTDEHDEILQFLQAGN
ncbi:MAG: cytochrome c [Planctomycetes bacterium]|nr:cytochrome c [Planctomycetota bacterium]